MSNMSVFQTHIMTTAFMKMIETFFLVLSGERRLVYSRLFLPIEMVHFIERHFQERCTTMHDRRPLARMLDESIKKSGLLP